MESEKFDRKIIYEEMDYEPQPDKYVYALPWIVQQQVAATNGIHYIDRIGKLKNYPIFSLPVKNASEKQIMLDIGCGWGRWMLGAANKNYLPIGIDLRLEFCKTARQTLIKNGKSGYTVVADLQNLPFDNNIFDLIWSFSVIQHTHKSRLENCLTHVNRILKPDGSVKLEFPSKTGIYNRIVNVKREMENAQDINSWSVRYYTISDYKNILSNFLTNLKVLNHSFLGIGILPEDLKYVSFKNKLVVIISLIGSFLVKIIKPLIFLSDSIYITGNKKSTDLKTNPCLDLFLEKHNKNPLDNLNICTLLICPISGGKLELSEDLKSLYSSEINCFYPIIDSIPILVKSEAIPYNK